MVLYIIFWQVVSIVGIFMALHWSSYSFLYIQDFVLNDGADERPFNLFLPNFELETDPPSNKTILKST